MNNYYLVEKYIYLDMIYNKHIISIKKLNKINKEYMI